MIVLMRVFLATDQQNAQPSPVQKSGVWLSELSFDQGKFVVDAGRNVPGNGDWTTRPDLIRRLELYSPDDPRYPLLAVDGAGIPNDHWGLSSVRNSFSSTQCVCGIMFPILLEGPGSQNNRTGLVGLLFRLSVNNALPVIEVAANINYKGSQGQWEPIAPDPNYHALDSRPAPDVFRLTANGAGDYWSAVQAFGVDIGFTGHTQPTVTLGFLSADLDYPALRVVLRATPPYDVKQKITLKLQNLQYPIDGSEPPLDNLVLSYKTSPAWIVEQTQPRDRVKALGANDVVPDVGIPWLFNITGMLPASERARLWNRLWNSQRAQLSMAFACTDPLGGLSFFPDIQEDVTAPASVGDKNVVLSFATSVTFAPQGTAAAWWWVDFASSLRFIGFRYTDDAPAILLTLRGVHGASDRTYSPLSDGKYVCLKGQLALNALPVTDLDASLVPDQFADKWLVGSSVDAFPPTLDIGAMSPTLSGVPVESDGNSDVVEFGVVHSGWYLVPDDTRSLKPSSIGPHGLRAVTFRINALPLDDLSPRAVDPLPDENRLSSPEINETELHGVNLLLQEAVVSYDRQRIAQPLLIPLAPGQNHASVSLFLNVEERVQTGSQRELEIRVRARSDTGVTGDSLTSILLLDPTPFVVALVRVPAPWAAFVRGRGQNSDIVAVWKLSSQDGAKWEIASEEDSFEFILPPQALGEAMEKGKDYHAILPKAGFAARLGEAARLTLRSSYAPTWFSEAPWNVRRVLGYAGQRAPGAGLIAADFELFYGMSASIDTSVAQRPLRMSELGARMGSFAPPLMSIPVAKLGLSVQRLYRARWLDALAKLARRLAVYEIWDEGEYVVNIGNAPKQATATLKLDKGVTFSLRPDAQVADPILRPGRLPGQNPGQIPRQSWVGTSEPRDNDPGGTSEPYLPGGIAWGFESDAIYQSVLRRPTSDSGSIEGVFLSALGGWGTQRAAFDNGRTRFYTHTAMGRGTYYALERVGRVGIFWNRAKHVIVYERSVLKGEQFSLDQEDYAGSPIMRKISEYVEIIESDRPFPEGQREKKTRGFVEAATFVSTIIPVDSRWGHDVVDGATVYGWEVPLWNPGASDPAQYPKPCIRLVVSGDPDGALAQPTVDFAEPEKLVFYTSVLDSDTDDTDKWASVLNVDYANQPPPAAEDEPPLNHDRPDETLASASLVLPGLERFTHALENHTGPANIVAERAPSLLGAHIDTVTLMRSNASSAGSGAGSFAATLRDGADGWNRTADHVRSVLLDARHEAALTADSAAAITRAIDDCIQRCEQSRSAWKALTSSANVPANLSTAIAGQADSFVDDLTARAGAAIDRVIASVVAARNALTNAIMQWPLDAQTGKLQITTDELKALFHNYTTPLFAASDVVELLFQEFESLQDAAKSALDEIVRSLNTIRRVADHVNASIPDNATIAAAISEAIALSNARLVTLLTLRSGSSAVLAVVLQAKLAPVINTIVQDLTTSLASLPVPVDDAWLTGLSNAVAACERNLMNTMDSVPAALRGAWTGLRDAVVTFDASLGWTLQTWRRDWSDRIDNVAASVGTTRQTIIEQINASLGAGDGGSAFCQLSPHSLLCGLSVIRQSLLGPSALRQSRTALVDAINGALANWTSSWAGGDPFQGIVTALRDARQQVSTAVGQAIGSVAQTVAGALNSPVAQQLHGWGNAIDDGLRRLNQAPTFQDPDSTLRLLRACGEGPIVPGLKFNRKRLAYIFSDYISEVKSTPAAALVNRVDQDLQALGLRIPIDRLLDRLVPASLENFDISTILPDFAGLRNAGLFSGIRLPAVTNDQVNIRHGVDKTTQSAWLKADFATALAGRNTLFDAFGLTLNLVDANFAGNASISLDIDGNTRKQTSGSIVGDWNLAFGGESVVTFRKTSLSMDDAGHLGFGVKPENIELSEVFNWLSDVIEAVSDPDAGFTVQLVRGDDGLPVCVRATLDLPCPPVGAGAASVTGLLLGAYFDVGLPQGGGDFMLSAGFNLGRREQPFVLLVSFLGGGGWLQAESRYTPSNGAVIATLTLGISVAAGAALNFGPAHGAVIISIGAYVECAINTRGGAPHITIGVAFVVNGEVSLFGMVTVSVTVVLLLTYDGGQIVGSGTLVASIKISIFCTLHVSTGVRYTLAGKKNPDSQRLDEAARKAKDEADRYA